MYFYKKVVFKTVQYFLQNKLYIYSRYWNLLYRDGSYCTCSNFQFEKLLNLYKLRLRIRVLLLDINEHQRSKEMRQSHDTKLIICITFSSKWVMKITLLIFSQILCDISTDRYNINKLQKLIRCLSYMLSHIFIIT